MVEADGDPPPVFDAAKEAFDDVALFVDRSVIMIVDFAVFARRDDWLGATLGKPFAGTVKLTRNRFKRIIAERLAAA